LMNKNVWDSLPEDIQNIVYYATEHMSEWCFIKRFNGQSKDIGNWANITTLDQDSLQKLFENELLEWENLAQRSPRCAEGVRILLEYKIELQERDWVHTAYKLDTKPMYDLLDKLKAEGLIQ
jgi:hypothetical protein